MADLLTKNGPVVADTVRVDGILAGRDVTFTLPEITPQTFDLVASGTYSMPIAALLENMEMTINKIGVDLGLRSMAGVGMRTKTYQFNWVQEDVLLTGDIVPKGCKAFVRAMPNKFPGISVAPGEGSDNEIGLTVSRLQIFVAGIEYCCIDKLNHIVRFDSLNVYDAIELLL